MYEEDEPNYANESQHFSEEVYQEMKRLLKYDAVAFAFPMYWNGILAIMKGYFNRVWNYNFAYGPGDTFKPQRILWLAAAGGSIRQMAKFDKDKAIATVFNVSAGTFCGIEKSKSKAFYGSTPLNSKRER